MKKYMISVLLFCFFINIFASLDLMVSKDYFGYDVAKAINDEYKIEDAIDIFENQDTLSRRSFSALISIYLDRIHTMKERDGHVPLDLKLLVGLEKMVLDFTNELEIMFSDNIAGLSRKVTNLEMVIAEKSQMTGLLKPHVNYKEFEPENRNPQLKSFFEEQAEEEKKEDIEKMGDFKSRLENNAAVQNIEKKTLDKNEYNPEFYKEVSFSAVDAELKYVIDTMIADSPINLFVSDSVNKRVTVQIKDMPLIEGLKRVAEQANADLDIDGKNLTVRSRDEIQEKVFRLKYLDNENAIELLSKFKSQGGRIIANPLNNTVIVYDTIESLKKMQSTLIDVDNANNEEKIITNVISLKYATAQDVLSVVNTLKSQEGNISANNQSNSLIVMDRKRNMKSIEELINKLDIPSFESRKYTYIYSVKYGEASAILQILQSDAFTGSVAKDVKLTSDERTNALVLTGNKDMINKILQYVEKLDIRTKQVTIAAKIIEVNLDNNNSKGLNMSVLAPDGSKNKSLEEENKITLKTFDALGDNRTAIKFGTLEKEQLELLYEKISGFSDAKIISSPTITTLDNQEAKILIGEKLPFEETTTSEGNTSSSINFKDVGITLTVTPKISPDNYITLKVHPEISQQNGTTTKGEPIIGTTEADTNVIIRNGETLVIGGLIKNNKVKSVTRAPVLGQLPLFRNLFRTVRYTDQRTETIVLITPHIIEDYKRNNNVYFRNYLNISDSEAVDGK